MIYPGNGHYIIHLTSKKTREWYDNNNPIPKTNNNNN